MPTDTSASDVSDIEAIFLDLGNTLRILLKDEAHQAHARREIARLAGAAADPDAFCAEIDRRYKVYRKWATEHWIEASEAELWTRWLLPEFPAERIAPLATELTFQYRQSMGRRVVQEDGPAVIKELHRRGYTLGIISNVITSREIPDWLAADGLTPYFKSVVMSSVCGKRKPDPAIYHEAAQRAGVAPSRCVYVGDNFARDVVGTRNAGFGMIIIIPDAEDRDAVVPAEQQPDRIIHTLSELLDLFPDRRTAGPAPAEHPEQNAAEHPERSGRAVTATQSKGRSGRAVTATQSKGRSGRAEGTRPAEAASFDSVPPNDGGTPLRMLAVSGSDAPTYGAAALAEAVRAAYRAGQTDYALEPLVAVDAAGAALGRIEDGDAVIFCCRRGEREIQLTEAFTEADFSRFPRRALHDLAFVILTLYHEKFHGLPVAFAPAQVAGTLGEAVSRAGLRQLRVAESEKYAHVTFFLNGGSSRPFPGEDDIRLPSPAGIPYEQVPELSLAEVAAAVTGGIAAGYDLIVTNFANGDVIGHTASRPAKLACAEAVSARLGQVVDAALAADTVVFITADHGNLEVMTHPDGTPHVAHTANLVPFIAVDPRAPAAVALRATGAASLADVAPTILAALGVAPPAALEGTDLAPEHDWGGPRKVLLVILDGWGLGCEDETNPIHLAPTPAWDELVARCGMARLQAAGTAVGLGAGKPGNSEAGHMNIGAGRVILQDDVRLDLALQDGTFAANPILLNAVLGVKRRGKRLHLIGLLSERSSHGAIDYPLALLRMAAAHGLSDACLHLIFDGRSTAPGSAPDLLEALERRLAEIGVGRVVSGVGRGIALDRSGNYAKTRRAYEAMVDGIGSVYRA